MSHSMSETIFAVRQPQQYCNVQKLIDSINAAEFGEPFLLQEIIMTTAAILIFLIHREQLKSDGCEERCMEVGEVVEVGGKRLWHRTA